MKEMLSKRAPYRPELDALLERARHYKMLPEEKAAQRRSWVVGEMMLEHPEMTRDEANDIYNYVIVGEE